MEKDQQIANTKLQKRYEIASYGNVSNKLINPPIKSILNEHGLEMVLNVVKLSIAKCTEALQINLSDTQKETLAEDLIEVYEWDSIEDIQEALKRGRQGEFGASYKQLNMIVVREWMRVILDEKAALREKAKQNEKKEEKKEPIQQSKQEYYDNYLRVEREKKEAKKKKTLSQMQFEAKKHEYFKNKNK